MSITTESREMTSKSLGALNIIEYGTFGTSTNLLLVFTPSD
jgi:hypothetical protein